MFEELRLKTCDNIDIAVNFYRNNFESVVIIAPGWCMTKDSTVFLQIAKEFSQKYDILSLDFRGHGKSGGFYTFSAKENNDLNAVVDFALSKNYKNIYLVGFSLGGGLVLINTAFSDKISKVIAVSPHSDFSKIENKMWKKEAWLETFKKFELKRFLSIRQNLLFKKMIKPIDIVDKIKVPTLFIAGKKDPTVCTWHTKNLYDKAVCEKEFKLYENGIHAEDLFIYHTNDFMQTCFNWLEK